MIYITRKCLINNQF